MIVTAVITARAFIRLKMENSRVRWQGARLTKLAFLIVFVILLRELRLLLSEGAFVH
jgi:hypothetical protein